MVRRREGELRRSARGGLRRWLRFRPGNGSNELGKVLQRCGVRLGSSGAKGSQRDGEERPARRALLALLSSSCTRARTKRKGDWQGSFQGVREEKSGAGARLPTRGVARRRPQRR